MVDQEICEDLGLGVTKFQCDLPQCVGIEGAKVSKSIINIKGWVEIELGVLGLTCLTTRLWVTKSLFNKGIPIVLGSHQIKKIFAEANVDRIKFWPQPWKDIYERCARSQWYSDMCSEDLSDSEDSEMSSYEITLGAWMPC